MSLAWGARSEERQHCPEQSWNARRPSCHVVLGVGAERVGRVVATTRVGRAVSVAAREPRTFRHDMASAAVGGRLEAPECKQRQGSTRARARR